MAPVMGDENGKREMMDYSCFWKGRGGGKADNIMKSGTAAGEAEGGGWRSKMTKGNWVNGSDVWLG
jgi:hypothetical protein